MNNVYDAIKRFMEFDDKNVMKLEIHKTDCIKFELSIKSNKEYLEINYSDFTDNVISKINKIYRNNRTIVDEKYSIDSDYNYYYEEFDNGRTLSFNGFSVDEINHIREVINNNDLIIEKKVIINDKGYTSAINVFNMVVWSSIFIVLLIGLIFVLKIVS